MKEIYILKSDVDGTIKFKGRVYRSSSYFRRRSKRFVVEMKEEGKRIRYTHSYEKVIIFENKDEALDFA
jgi:hypothetical protein